MHDMSGLTRIFVGSDGFTSGELFHFSDEIHGREMLTISDAGCRDSMDGLTIPWLLRSLGGGAAESDND